MKIGLHRKNGVIFRETKYRQTLESSGDPAYPNYTVEDALKKWGVDTKKGVDAGGVEH